LAQLQTKSLNILKITLLANTEQLQSASGHVGIS